MSNPFQTPGAFSWVELTTDDTDSARQFYGELFGWQFDTMHMVNDAPYHVIKTGNGEIGGVMGKPPGMPAAAPNAWTAYVTVADADATAEKARALGAEILIPPTDIPDVGRMVWLRDPQGAVIAAVAYVVRDHGG